MACLAVFKRLLDNALHNMLELLVSPEVVRQLDWMIVVGPFQLNYAILFHLLCSVQLQLHNLSVRYIRSMNIRAAELSATEMAVN